MNILSCVFMQSPYKLQLIEGIKIGFSITKLTLFAEEMSKVKMAN